MVHLFAAHCTLLAALFSTSAAASPKECDCEAACAQIVARQREEIAHLQAELRAARGGAPPPARRAAAAETACGSNWTVTTSADVGPLQGCRSVGTLTISNTDLTDLTGLESLETAESLTISGNAELETLAGLESLSHVHTLYVAVNPKLRSIADLQRLEVVEDFQILVNVQLDSLMGLGKLTRVGFGMAIAYNNMLESLSGLENLTRLGALAVWHNAALKSVVGLERLEIAEDGISIKGNHKLQSLAGLQSLKTAQDVEIEDNAELEFLDLPRLETVELITIRQNAKLKSFAGLEKLSRIGSVLTVHGNSGLESLAGLQNLHDAEDILIEENDRLESLAGLGNFTRMHTLVVRRNPRLKSFTGLEKLSRIGGLLTIQGNGGLESLAGLQNLQGAYKILVQENHGLESLAGLQNLQDVENVNIEDNDGLESLAGFGNLMSVRTLQVGNNARLRSPAGMRLKAVGRVTFFDNAGLRSLTGFEDIAHLDSLEIFRNHQLRSIASLRSLETAKVIRFHFNRELPTLAGLEGLRRVDEELEVSFLDKLTSLSGLHGVEVAGDVLIDACDGLTSLSGLEGLRRVATIQLSNLRLNSLAGLEGLTHAWGGVMVKTVLGLHSLDGLSGLRSSGSLTVTKSTLEYLGTPFASGAPAGVIYFSEDSWPRCVTPHERMTLVSHVQDMNTSLIPNVTHWDQACGEDSGTFSCTRGLPCNFSLVGKVANYTSVFVSGRFTGCQACSGPRPQGNVVEGDVAEDNAVDLGYALKDEEAGLHSICRCGADATKPVAQLLLRGPWQSSVQTCSRGHDCTVTLKGEGLEPTDRVVLMSSCSGDPRKGFPASWVAENTYLINDRATWYAAPPAYYQVCWRAPCTSAPDGPTCPAPEDSYIQVTEVELRGAFHRNYTQVLGERLSVPNIGLGVSDGDQMRLRRACGEASEDGRDALAANSSELVFDFGWPTEAGTYHLCWCQERKGVECTAVQHFTADAGVVQILCPTGQELTSSGRCMRCPPGKEQRVAGLQRCSECPIGKFSPGGSETCEACPTGSVAWLGGSRVCVPCPRWQTADEEAAECLPDPARLPLLVALCLSVGGFCAVLVHATKRRLLVVDVSLVGGQTIVTTFRSHGLANFGRKHFPVRFRGTGHPGLESPRQPFRAKVKDTLHLELLTSAGESIDQRLDTSMGTLIVAFPSDLRHQRIVVLGLPALLAAVASLGGLVVLLGMYVELFMWATLSAVAGATAAMALRYWPCTTPLQQRLSEFTKRHSKKLRGSEIRRDKGPDRAIAVGKLHELLQFFHDFIQDRTAYFLDGNIIQPLTKPEEVSYAEFVGAERVEWFVSHFWGTSFEHFCAALRKHAETVCAQRKWTQLKYWVCFCSNNQHRIQQELGKTWAESSFYLTLQSGECKGTCMVLDDKALPLTRIWCIFELLQTVKLEQRDPNFQGLLLCTSGGVLNNGSGSAEVAVALAEKVAAMNLATAQASSESDAKMIRDQVRAEMGTFAALNSFVCREVRRMLVRAQQGADQQFAAVFTDLDQALEENAQQEREEVSGFLVTV